MDRAKLKSLLYEIGLSGGKRGDLKDSGDNIQFCCPFHGETRPSAGIHVYDEIGRCFSCGESFNLVKLVAHCMNWRNSFRDKDGKSYEGYNYKKAEEWLEEKYNVDKKKIYREVMGVQRIEDEELERLVTRHEMDRIKLAVFKSGKVTHNYFFSRGFTKETVRKFLIGWDSKRMRITIPVLWEDGVPCGVIGRAVLEMKIDGKRNEEFYKVYKYGNDFKYHIYDNFPVGDILYPLPHFKPIDDTAIIVEGQIDAIWCHQMGFPQVLSSLGSKLSYNRRLNQCKQIDILHRLGVKKVILLRDKDEAGKKGAEHDYVLLKKEGIAVYGTDYPKDKNDPQELTASELQFMINSKYPFNIGTNNIKRIED